MRRYWTKQELIDYLMRLAREYEVDGHRADNDKDRWHCFGKSEAYAQAAFELEHNVGVDF